MPAAPPIAAHEQDAATVLAELARRTAELKARPAPPSWQPFAAWEHADQLKYGPRYSPSAWFGAVSENQRVRYLRAVRRLDRAGLVVAVRTGKRLTHVKLTAAGERAAAELNRQAAGQAAGGD